MPEVARHWCSDFPGQVGCDSGELYAPGGKLKLLALGQLKTTVPLACIKLEQEGLRGTWKVGVLKNLPAAELVGNDMISLPKAVNIVTGKREYVPEFTKVTSEEGKAAERKGKVSAPLSAENISVSQEKGDSSLRKPQPK